MLADVIIVALFVFLSLSIGAKLAFVIKLRYSELMNLILLAAAIAQAVLLLIIVWGSPLGMAIFAVLVLAGSGAGLLYNRLKPRSPVPHFKNRTPK